LPPRAEALPTAALSTRKAADVLTATPTGKSWRRRESAARSGPAETATKFRHEPERPAEIRSDEPKHQKAVGGSSMADRTVNPFAPITATANEQIARQIVERIKSFRTDSPLGATWQAFAVSEVLAALNDASRRRR
jgi:hypothetical protein